MIECYISPWQEHLFWVSISQDHAIFVEQALAPGETPLIETARGYKRAFGELLERIRHTDPALLETSPVMVELSQAVYPVMLGYYQFEGELQRRRMNNEIVLSLTPSFFNGTGLESEEYLRILSYWTRGVPYPPLTLVQLMGMWLEDQLGHAVLLRDHLDPAEIQLIVQCDAFIRQFEGFILQNEAIKLFLHYNAPNFPAQRKFARQIAQVVAAFYRFVEGVVVQYKNTELLSRLTLRFLEHHLPETCYFLSKLACFNIAVREIEDCQLLKPSFPWNIGMNGVV
ncbi:DUF2935 domain-containing protein [Paenibacillus athensensis]|uniref:DUF2935 domain-containing protein n=1 Tax=Paenibacillus athensensis TaxID=1967502 RepID=A0A4Y8Q624_9BACL|nr:DUF2935 domain-containing protein [Paenibacillus athensensis]MCD1259600.1 DUF2935 domain-containing protein [Paenibacillus athensensis]